MTDPRNRAGNGAGDQPNPHSDRALEEAADALGALASEHRVAILRELAAADEPLRFSELRERVVLAAGDLDPEGAAALADAYDRAGTEDGECPVCGEPNCDRVVHVHLSGSADGRS